MQISVIGLGYVGFPLAVQAASKGLLVRGVDSNPDTVRAALLSLGPTGRAAIAGISDLPVSIHTYREIIGTEAEIIGVSDHTRAELELLLDLVARGRLELADVVTEQIPFEIEALNERLDRLDAYTAPVRTVMTRASRDSRSDSRPR